MLLSVASGKANLKTRQKEMTMSADKKRALRHRLAFVARAASECGLLTGHSGFPPSNARIIERLENEGLIARRRLASGGRATRTIFHATPKGRAVLASAGLSPSCALPNATELHETPFSRRKKQLLALANNPAFQSAERERKIAIRTRMATTAFQNKSLPSL
jgi:DNA-binding PadR family transcriptional regulator